ncbi:MAG: nucleotidyltransferase substrate binding protein [Elusimicrobia bacterium]|nr:nucleotidyltransferase substrate binding protein [Elusimicrobiota bacterium]
MTKGQALGRQFSQALNRLKEALKEKKTNLNRDAAIKRFELAFDLSWKMIKALLEEEGIPCASPLGCFKEAYRQNLIDYEEIWIEMVKTRNKTVHTYDEELAQEVYGKLPAFCEALQKLALKRRK